MPTRIAATHRSHSTHRIAAAHRLPAVNRGASAVQGPQYAGPLMLQIGNNSPLLPNGQTWNAFWQQYAVSTDYALATFAQRGNLSGVTGVKIISLKTVDVTSANLTTLTGLGITHVLFSDETTQNVATLQTNLTNVISGNGGLGIAALHPNFTVYYAPLGAAIDNATPGAALNTLLSTADGVLYQSQRHMDDGITTYGSEVATTVNTIRTDNGSLFQTVQAQVYSPQTQTVYSASFVESCINVMANDCAAVPSLISIVANTTQQLAVMQTVFEYYRAH